jgi:hypothetical protein
MQVFFKALRNISEVVFGCLLVIKWNHWLVCFIVNFLLKLLVELRCVWLTKSLVLCVEEGSDVAYFESVETGHIRFVPWQ